MPFTLSMEPRPPPAMTCGPWTDYLWTGAPTPACDIGEIALTWCFPRILLAWGVLLDTIGGDIVSEESTSYDASNIQVLEGREAVRKRPGMYIGSTSERGLRHMVFEIADRAVNEVLDGRATSVVVTLTPDGGVYVADDGPGVPIDETGASDGLGLEALLTQMQAGTGVAGRHDITLGFCGVGPAVVNALSQRMTAEVRREGVRWVQEYARGVATTPLTAAGTATESGTTIAFWPDADIFGAAEFSFDGLEERFRELAFLNQGLEISLIDLRPRMSPVRSGSGSRAGQGTSSPSSTGTWRRPPPWTPSPSSTRTLGWRG